MHPHVSLSNKCGMRLCSRVTRLKLSFICPYLFFMSHVYVQFLLRRCVAPHRKTKISCKTFLPIDRHCKRVDRIFLSTILSLSIHDWQSEKMRFTTSVFLFAAARKFSKYTFRIALRHRLRLRLRLRSCLWVTSFACTDLFVLSLFSSIWLFFSFLLVEISFFNYASFYLMFKYWHSYAVLVCWSPEFLWLRTFLFYVQLTYDQFTHLFFFRSYEHEYMPAIDIHSLTIIIYGLLL